MDNLKPDAVSAWTDNDGIWLELKMNSDFAIKIQIDLAETEKLAAELKNAAATWKSRKS